MTDATYYACEARLRDMIEKGWVNICCIDEILKATGTVPDAEAYQTLRLLHCVDFKKMAPSLQQQIPDLLKKCFGGIRISADEILRPTFDRTVAVVSTIDVSTVLESQKPRWWRSLLAGKGAQ